MSAAKWSAAWAIIGLSASALAAPSDTVSLSYYETLQRLSIQGQRIDAEQKPGVGGPVNLSFDALGRSFELQLSPNNNLLAAAREYSGGNVVPYRGRLAGNPDSWVRIVLANGQPAGLIWDGSEVFAIERPGTNVAGTDSAIIYRLADAAIAPGAMTCGSGAALTNAGAIYESLVGELGAVKQQAAGAASEINVGAVGDAEFFNRFGTSSQQEIIDRLNIVDGIFSAQLGIQITVPIVQVFSNAAAGSYPFSDTVIASDLLDELAAYRDGEPNQYAHGLTHLWTGKDVEGSPGNNSTVGIAFSGTVGQPNNSLVLCSRRFGAGLSEGSTRATFDGLVAAHEIGHNFGAPHDGTTGSACESETGAFLMAASLNGNNQFSQCSLDQMADDIAAASCIVPLPGVDLRIGLNGQDPTILLGNTATVTFDVANTGTDPATNVVAEITLPNNVSLISAASSTGSCSSGAGIVSCMIGDVAGNSTVAVIMTSDTTAVGTGSFDASVSSNPADDDLTNNQGSGTLTVQPAVNLVITPPSARQVNVNDSVTLAASLQNTSILDATGVTLSISLSSGLRADSASWALGNCTVSRNQIECQATTFAAQSNTTLSLGLTAITDGANTLSLSMASLEDDANPADNTVSASVTVGTPPDNDSGGGAMGLWLVALLGALVAIRRRKPA